MKLQGFETKPGTDHIVRGLVNSVNGTMYKRIGPVVDMWERTEWESGYNYEDPIAVWGILRGTSDLIKQVKTWYYFDHAYIAGKKHGKTFLGEPIYRLTKNWYHQRDFQNAFDPNGINRKRIKRYKGKYQIKPWKRDGKYILVCPPTPNMEIQFDKKDWLSDTLRILQKNTDRKILIRDKYCDRPLAQDLKDAYAMVSCTTAASIDAILAGVPSFCDQISVARPVSHYRFDFIEEPLYSPFRREWIDTLLTHQFTMSEIYSQWLIMNIILVF